MEEKLTITPLGAGSEVGRSCVHIKYLETEILLDCGIHPAFVGQCSLPYIDLIDLSKIDAVFITHFHLDHGGGLPYLTEKTHFNGRVFMTHPTKSILRLLLNDYTRLVSTGSEDNFSDSDLKKCMDRIRTIDYYQQIRINDLKITALNAGHVLGAAMFLIQANNSLILYTGDFSREEDRHLKEADLPSVVNQKTSLVDLNPNKINFLICESTYGVGCHFPKSERELRFLNEVLRILERGGRALLPVFALGRAQELLLILEEHWNSYKLKFPIYYVSKLAKKCINIYQTYLTMMNQNIQKQSKPFSFKNVYYLDSLSLFEDNKPCVMVCSPGMLQSGVSRELFDKWCTDSKNGVILTGYSVIGTLAKEILSEPSHITTLNGSKVPLNMSVSFISFSAHVDFLQNSSYISTVQPKKVFLVHGEINEMQRLKNALLHNNKELECIILKNGESCSVNILQTELVSVPLVDENVSFKGVLVKSKKVKVIRPGGLNLIQRQSVYFNHNVDCVKKLLKNHFTDLYFETDGIRTGDETQDENQGENQDESINTDRIEIGDENLDQSIKTGDENQDESIKTGDENLDQSIKTGNANQDESINTGESFRIGEIKIFLNDKLLKLEWQGSFKNDLLAMTIARIANLEEGVFLDYKVKSRTELVIDILKNYFENVNLNNGIIVVEEQGLVYKVERSEVIGQGEYRDRIEEVVKRVSDVLG